MQSLWISKYANVIAKIKRVQRNAEERRERGKHTLSFFFASHSSTRYLPSFRVPLCLPTLGYSTSGWFFGYMYFLPPPITTCRVKAQKEMIITVALTVTRLCEQVEGVKVSEQKQNKQSQWQCLTWWADRVQDSWYPSVHMSHFFYLLFASLALRVGVEGCWRWSKLSLVKDRVRSHDIFAQYFLLLFFSWMKPHNIGFPLADMYFIAIVLYC